MKKLIKKFSFWLPLLSVCVVVNNLIGNDDKNLLLGFTGPPLLMFNSELTKLHYSMEDEQWFYFIYYAIHVSFWLLLGLVIDWVISRFKKKLKGKKYAKN